MFLNYLKSLTGEFAKIKWITAIEFKQNIYLVIFTLLVFSIFFSTIDLLVAFLLKQILI